MHSTGHLGTPTNRSSNAHTTQKAPEEKKNRKHELHILRNADTITQEKEHSTCTPNSA